MTMSTRKPTNSVLTAGTATSSNRYIVLYLLCLFYLALSNSDYIKTVLAKVVCLMIIVLDLFYLLCHLVFAPD